MYLLAHRLRHFEQFQNLPFDTLTKLRAYPAELEKRPRSKTSKIHKSLHVAHKQSKFFQLALPEAEDLNCNSGLEESRSQSAGQALRSRAVWFVLIYVQMKTCIIEVVSRRCCVCCWVYLVEVIL